MRSPHSIFRVISIIVGLASASGGAEWAEKMFEPGRDHDFGTIAGGAKAQREFCFTNIYKEPVRILGVASSCQCTSATPKDDKRLYGTGEKGTIVASVNSSRFRGKKGATITVRFDVPSRPGIRPDEVRFNVRSHISNVVVENGCVWFGPIEEGSPCTQTVRVTIPPEPIGQTAKKVEALVRNEHLKAEIVPTPTEGVYSLRVHVAATAKPGLFPETVTLRVDGQQIPLEVVGSIRAGLSVTPARLSLLAQAGEKVTKNLVVRSTEPVRIRAIHCEDGHFSLLEGPEQGLKAVHVIPVTYLAGNQGGTSDSVIRLDFEGREKPEVVHVHVEVAGPNEKTLAGQ